MAEERVQRRLAAILAADVVGYSGLMEADEAVLARNLLTWHASNWANDGILRHANAKLWG